MHTHVTLLGHHGGCLVVDRLELLAKATPVGVEVEKNDVCGSCGVRERGRGREGRRE